MALAALALSAALAADLPAAELFTFAALGDTPYNAEEESRFPGLVAEMNREPLAFVIHVGDFKAAIQPCTDELFRSRREWFDLVRHPFIFVPGDNEWTDCRRGLGPGHDPMERLQKLRELFFSGKTSLGQRPLPLARQSRAAGGHDYPEHVRWEHRGVLFVTLNAPGPDNNRGAMPEEYARRRNAIRDWLDLAFRSARERGLKGVVVVMHANPWGGAGKPRRGFDELLATLGARARAFDGQVLLVHGDTHHYRVDRPLLDGATGALANFMRVEVFGSPFVNWVRIRVSEEGGAISFAAEPGS
jgi:hypothetical protein